MPSESGTRYWAAMANPKIYRIEDALKEKRDGLWTVKRSQVRVGDRVAIWKGFGGEGHRGIVSFAEVVSPVIEAPSLDDNYWVPLMSGSSIERRALMRYITAPNLPLWTNGPHHELLESLSVARGQGTIFKITTEQWKELIEVAGGWDPEEESRQFAPVSWREAVTKALIRHATVKSTSLIQRSELVSEELDRIVADTQSERATPEQTLSRVLQELRDGGQLEFLSDGQYNFIPMVGTDFDADDPGPGSIVFGDILGYPPGSIFSSRQELHTAGLHRHTMAGISGSDSERADAIVLSGGYQDDQVDGDLIIYTGQGGNRAGRQVADQTFTMGNLGLAASQQKGLPVRVIRGSGHRSMWSPQIGYVYSGLYTVDHYWHETGRDGFKIYRYRLHRALLDLPPIPQPENEIGQNQQADAPVGDSSPDRAISTGSRIIRETAVPRWVKNLYQFRCQVCDSSQELPAGPYAEGAHIKPLGRPHGGPDIPENVLCLCPNHHLLFDTGAISVSDDYRIIGGDGRIAVNPRHEIDLRFLQYHRDHILK